MPALTAIREKATRARRVALRNGWGRRKGAQASVGASSVRLTSSSGGAPTPMVRGTA